MPKIGQSIGKLLTAQRKSSTAEKYVAKTETERMRAVMEIWNSIPKAVRKFPTQAEQEAYLSGIVDERRVQMDYDSKLREAGLR